MKGKGEGSKMRQGKLLDKLQICKCKRKVGGSNWEKLRPPYRPNKALAKPGEGSR